MSDDISSQAAENASENEFIALTSQNNQVLSQVMEALRQVDAGNYGQCVDCDKPIPIERMKALNYATRCVKCQEKVGLKKSLNSEFSGVERDDE
jgi:DnaK suppressor protein